MDTTNPLWILAVLGLAVALSEWLARHTPLRHLGSALLVIVIVAVAANVGVIPAYSGEIPVYAGIFDVVAPLAIFLLLLRVHLAGLMRAGGPMLLLFGLGSAGTMAGVLLGMRLVGGDGAFDGLGFALGGMYTGTYTGGSINFNAVAIAYDVNEHAALYAGAAAVDNVATTIWMVATVALPRLLSRWMPRRAPAEADDATISNDLHETELERVGPFDLALLLALAAGAVWLSDALSARAAALVGFGVPSILILTTLALALAQVPAVQRLRGARLTGWLAVMLFLAVIGALCDLEALRGIGPLALRLVALVGVTIAVHGFLLFGAGALVRADADVVAVASQANIGGSTSALALARSLGRGDLMLPAVLVGSLGNAVGTYLGFLVAHLLS